MPTSRRRAIRLTAATVSLVLASGCAGARGGGLGAPRGATALGLEFGKDRAAAERALAADGIAHRPVAGDADALLADRCRDAPAGPCLLLFGPEGLYAAQVEVPAAEEAALVSSVTSALGAPAPADAARPEVVATWTRPGWSVGVARHAPEGAPASAVLHVEYEEAAPPVVLGVPLGRLRVDVEHLLDRQGAVLQAREPGASTYLGCPQGTAEALTCVVGFVRGRAASVTEVYPARAGDDAALAAWRELAARYEAEIGRAPATACPPSGPDRVGGDCTATWASDKLTVVVGAHRGAGSKHRGAISVYTGFSYPPLAAPAGDATAAEAAP